MRLFRNFYELCKLPNGCGIGQGCKSLYLRRIAFNCLYCVFARIYYGTFNISGFCGFVACALRFCRVAFLLVMLSRLNFSLVLAFGVFVGVLVWVRCFRALCGKI